MRAERERETKVKEHADELRKQIAMKENNQKQAVREKYESGKNIKDFLNKEHNTLERIKKEKIQQMKDLNIPDKYQVDLVKLKV